MTSVNRKDDLLTLINKLEGRVRNLERVDKYDNDSDAPPIPPTVDLSITVNERKTHIEYRAIATWGTSTPNTCQADVDYWICEIQPTDSTGDPIDQVDFPSGFDAVDRVQNIPNKGQSNPHMAFGPLPHANEFGLSRWYWRSRVRIVDNAHRKGPWSSWTGLKSPIADSNDQPPVPTAVTLSMNDTYEQSKEHQVRAVVQCAEITNWDVTGGDKEPDVRFYVFQLRVSKADGTAMGGNPQPRTRTIPAHDKDTDTVASATFESGLKPRQYYQARARAVDRFNRTGAWSNWTPPALPNDNIDPPAPIHVRAYGTIRHVVLEWQIPKEGSDTELPNQKIAYFQVQLSYGLNFHQVVRNDIFVNSSRKSFESKHYKTKMWMRVRSVDASGNKSAWVQKGPVKPLRAGAAQHSPEDIDWTNSSGIALAGGDGNRAFLQSNTANACTVIEAGANEDGVPRSDGLLEARIQLSKTNNRARAGLAFRVQDVNNFLFVELRKTAAGPGVINISKMDTGVITNLYTDTDTQITEGAVIDLQLIMEVDLLTVYVNDVLHADGYALATADQTQFGLLSSHGIYVDYGASNDDGGSRINQFMFSDAEGYDAIIDYFGVKRSNITMGSAETGQPWVPQSGTWGVKHDTPAYSIQGISVQQPWFVQIDNSGHSPTLHPQSGVMQQYQALSFNMSSAFRLICIGLVEGNQGTPSPYGLLFYMPVRVGGGTGTTYNGSYERQYYPNDTNRYQMSNFREFYYDPQGVTTQVDVYWGLKTGDSVDRTFNINRMKLIVLLSYAPDMDPLTTPAWTKDSSMIAAYQNREGDDT